MQPGGNFAEDPASRLAASARGWHSIQLAVLGFIGLCGVLQTGADASGPGWLQWLATALSISSLVIAGVATFLVGRVAYPLYASGLGVAGIAGPQQLEESTRALRTGIRVTFAAVTLLAIAGASGWWPDSAAEGSGGTSIEVRDAAGSQICGELRDGQGGVLRIDTAQGLVSVRATAIASIRPVSGC